VARMISMYFTVVSLSRRSRSDPLTPTSNGGTPDQHQRVDSSRVALHARDPRSPGQPTPQNAPPSRWRRACPRAEVAQPDDRIRGSLTPPPWSAMNRMWPPAASCVFGAPSRHSTSPEGIDRASARSGAATSPDRSTIRPNSWLIDPRRECEYAATVDIDRRQAVKGALPRRRAASPPGGRPNWRLYSRLNWEELSYPTW